MSRKPTPRLVSDPAPPGADLAALSLRPDSPVRDVLGKLDKTGKGIILVVDSDQKLVGTVTDGDIRRWILANQTLDRPLAELLAQKKSSNYPSPVTALAGTPSAALLAIMHERVIHQIPLLDIDGRVVDLATMEDLLPSEPLAMEAVIMAGGFGKRLAPLTSDLPKPMLPVGNRPLLELIVEQLQTSGIRRVNVTTHYKAEKIIDHFGDGSRFGVDLRYVSEERPLGTAGALGLMDAPSERLLVMNGDILTAIDFRQLLKYHQEQESVLTVGVRKYEVKVPYGVIESNGSRVLKVVEKPSLSFFVNAGVYLLEPSAHKYIPTGERFDMTDLIGTLIEKGHIVSCFPILEYWLDIGKHDDYAQANDDIKTGRFAA